MRIIILIAVLMVPVSALAVTPLQECISSMTEHPDAEATRICRDFITRDEKVMREVMAERNRISDNEIARLNREEAAIRAQLQALQTQAVISLGPSLMQGFQRNIDNMRLPYYPMPMIQAQPQTNCVTNRVGNVLSTHCY